MPDEMSGTQSLPRAPRPSRNVHNLLSCIKWQTHFDRRIIAIYILKRFNATRKKCTEASGIQYIWKGADFINEIMEWKVDTKLAIWHFSETIYMFLF